MKIAVILYSPSLVNSFTAHVDELIKRGHQVKVFASGEDWIASVEKFVEEFKPEVIWTWNGKFVWYGGIFLKLKERGFRVVVSEMAWLPQKNHHFVCDLDDAFHHCTYQVPNNYPIDSVALKKVKESYHIDPIDKKGYVLVPLQLEGDTSILYRSEYIKTNKALCEQASFHFPDKEIVVKNHPLAPGVRIKGYNHYEGKESTLSLAVNAECVCLPLIQQ